MSGPIRNRIIPEDTTGELSGPCEDCGKETIPRGHDGRPLFKHWDWYLVRDEVWAEAGMVGWSSGYLCTPCLTTRLGRPLTEDDYDGRPVRATSRYLEVENTPAYIDRVLSGRGY